VYGYDGDEYEERKREKHTLYENEALPTGIGTSRLHATYLRLMNSHPSLRLQTLLSTMK
jgi:hypothetical protein